MSWQNVVGRHLLLHDYRTQLPVYQITHLTAQQPHSVDHNDGTTHFWLIKTAHIPGTPCT